MYSLVLLLEVRAFGFTDFQKKLLSQGPPLCMRATTTVVSILAHCEPILPIKTDTEGFRMNPLDVSESIDTWM